jgi:hypothetical protein
MQKHSKSGFYTLIFLYFASLSYLGNEVARFETYPFLVTLFTAFFAYLFLCRLETDQWQLLTGLGILVRLSFFFSIPALSDDFYRFLWDGHLILEGINPYQSIPEEIREAVGKPILYEGLNSPGYYTIYPPLNQLIFVLGAGSEHLLTSVNMIRLVLLIADLGAWWMIRKLSNSRSLPLWYFLNPAVVLEFTGNLHFEGLVVFFLLWGLYLLQKGQFWKAGLSLGGAIGVKLLPLILLPFLGWKFRWRSGILLVTISITVALFLLLPMIFSWSQPLSSFKLYFQSFEFNASFYYLFREIGFWTHGYNLIQQLGPQLALFTGMAILTFSVWAAYQKVATGLSLALVYLIYLSFATTVHPWYVLPLIPLGLMSGYYFPIVWSFTALFSYLGYQADESYLVPKFWIWAEYLILWGYFIFELTTRGLKR